MNLILFTNHFPYHKSEQFLVNEFDFAKDKFKNIIIYTLTATNNAVNYNLGSNTTIYTPVFANHKSKLDLILKGIFNGSPLKYHLKDFFKNKLYTNLSKLRAWFISILVTRAAISNKAYSSILNIINESSEGTVLYFYWGNNLCWMLPYLMEKITQKNIKVVIRFHRTDLYEYVNNDYAPIREFIFKSAHQLVAISQDGFNYLIENYPNFKHKVVLSKLGVFDNGLNPMIDSVNFTIVSVSFVTSVKRVSLILEALKHSKKNITWYHFGDGPLLKELKLKAAELPNNIVSNFMGFTKNQNIMTFYKEKQVDLFINVSLSEGLPVSIMEAASFGIPIMATNVGGTSEIVNSKTGKLLPVKISELELVNEIDLFLSMPTEVKLNYRKNARYIYENELNANVNYQNFYNEIMNLN